MSQDPGGDPGQGTGETWGYTEKAQPVWFLDERPGRGHDPQGWVSNETHRPAVP